MAKFQSRACVVAQMLESRVLFAALPTGFSETTLSGLAFPTSMSVAPDGRVFVSEQGGFIRIIENGQLLPTPFATVTVNDSGERGMLGNTLDPNFATNHYVYAFYTATTPTIHNRVSRFTADGDVMVPGSEVDLLDMDTVNAVQHNAGAIGFGADGKLYIATSDNEVPANSQSLANTFGKILRINSDGSIPTDNPFYSETTGNNRAIWALGLRNPFTMNFQPGTGRLFINDVGEDTWEEIDEGKAGANYGWPTTEGPTTDPQFTSPFHAYTHGVNDVNGNCIAGGAFYNPATVEFPSSYVGKYFYADYGGGWIHYVDTATQAVTVFATGIINPVNLQVDTQGNLYYLSRGSNGMNGVLSKISFGNKAGPVVGSGTGLQGSYFNNETLTGSPAVVRVDPTVNFSFGSGSPASGVQSDHFSARWLGFVQAQFTETYTFHTITDDGVRLWVNGQLLVDDWNMQNATEKTGTISLVAGQKYSIRMEYFDRTGEADANLMWSSTSTPVQPIPKTQLYPHQSVTYQAESATLHGAKVVKDNAGYTGSGYADYQNASGDYVEWSINQDIATTQELDIRYANLGASRPLQLMVDGVVVTASLAFPSTGAWNKWGTVSVFLNLTVGTHKIRLTAIGSSGPNIDSLTVR
jgi:glucose/arabinose dehydrogenase